MFLSDLSTVYFYRITTMNKKKTTAVLVSGTLLTATLIAVVCIGLFLPREEEIIQGEVEMTDYRLASKVSARVKRIMVEEGDDVRVGDTLVILDAPDVMARLEQAEAAYRAALAQSNKADNGTRSEQVRQAYESWQRAKAGLAVAEKTYGRVLRLFEQGVMAAQKHDEALAQRDAAAALEAAAKAQYDMAVAGARVEDRSAASAQADRAAGSVREIESYMGETCLVAFADGYVTEIFPEEGEFVAAGAPLMNVACPADLWFTFNVREDLLKDVSVGQELKVYVPAVDVTVACRVTRVNNVGNFAAWKATKAMDGLDLKTFEVRAKPLERQTNMYAGMSAVIKR